MVGLYLWRNAIENATMGRVTAAARIENLADTVFANAGHLRQEEIRVLEIPDALVDTGATRLSLPRPLIDQLGLTRYGSERHVKSIMFLDGAGAKARDAVHILFAGEKVRPESLAAAPTVEESQADPAFCVLSLEALLRMKLTAFRDKDRTHIRDMIDVGLVDASWLDRLPPELTARLKELLDNPEG